MSTEATTIPTIDVLGHEMPEPVGCPHFQEGRFLMIPGFSEISSAPHLCAGLPLDAGNLVPAWRFVIGATYALWFRGEADILLQSMALNWKSKSDELLAAALRWEAFARGEIEGEKT